MTYLRLRRSLAVFALGFGSTIAVGCAPTDDDGAAQSIQALDDRDEAYARISEGRRDLHDKGKAHARVLDRGRDQLAQLSPALTNDQIKTYAANFAKLDTSVDALAAYVDASIALAKTLDDVFANRDLFDTMMTLEHGAMVAAYREVAETPAAGSTIRFVGRVLTKQDPDHLAQFALVPALPPAMFEALVRTGSVDAAVDKLCKDLGGPSGPAAPVVAALNAMKAGSALFTGKEELTFQGVDFSESLRQTAAVVAIWKAGGSPASSDPRTGGNDAARNLRTAVQQSPNAIRAVAMGANFMRMAMGGKEAAWLADLAAGAKVAGMGINFALAAFDTLASLGDLDDGSDKVRLLGNGVSLVAAALGFTPVGAAGIALGAAAFAIKLYASFLAKQEKWDLYEEEKSKCLKGVLPDDVVVALSEAHPKHLALFGSLAMDPADVQWLAPRIHDAPDGVDSDIFGGITSTENGSSLLALRVADKVFRLSPSEDGALLKAAAGSGDFESQRRALWRFFWMLEYQPNASGWNENITTTKALDILSRRAALDASGADGKAAFTRARTYLAGLRR